MAVRQDWAGAPACSIVLVGASSGGRQAMAAVLAALPVDVPVPVVVAQYQPRDDGSRLRPFLARHSTLRVTDAADGAQLEAETVYVVPNGMDLVAGPDGRVTLTPCSDLPACPCIDRMFSAAAGSLGGGVVAVVLSGTGRDGAEGVVAGKRAGGTVIAEDDRSTAFRGPTAAADAGTVDVVLTAPEIGAAVAQLAQVGAS